MAINSQTPARRVPELDGVRGVAVLGVVYWHCFADHVHPGGGAFVRLAEFLGTFAWGGVDLFFVLSGFLIGGILLEHRRAANLFSVFYVRRLLRIWPVYYIWLTASVLLTLLPERMMPGLRPQFAGRLPWWFYFGHVQNIGYAKMVQLTSAWLMPTWSLAVEEQFYLIAPILMRSLRPRGIAVLAATGYAGSTALRWHLIRSGNTCASYVLLPARADALLLGVLAAWALRQDGVLDCARAHVGKLQLLFVALLAACFAGAAHPDRTASQLVAVFGSNLVGALALCFITLALVSPWRGWLRKRWLSGLGSISYGVYLLHDGIFSWARTALLDRGDSELSGAMATATLLSIAVTVITATLLFHVIERPCIGLGRRLRYKADQPHGVRDLSAVNAFSSAVPFRTAA